jgi:hypothetical protein
VIEAPNAYREHGDSVHRNLYPGIKAESRTLASSRDALLPKMLSGQIRV